MELDIQENVQASEQKKKYKMIALRSNVLFPGQTLNFDLGKDKSARSLLDEARNKDEDIFIATQRNKAVAEPLPDDIYKVGVLAHVQQVLRLPNDNVRIVVKGMRRAVLDEVVGVSPYEVTLSEYGDKVTGSVEEQAIIRAIKEMCLETLKLDQKLNKDVLAQADVGTVDKLIYELVYFLYHGDEEKQRVLEIHSQYNQLEDIYAKLLSSYEILEVEKKIAKRVKDSVDKNQKEYYLREQLKAIHEELGDDENEKEQYFATAEKKGLPEYAVEKLKKELNRLDKMAPNSPEAGIIRTYVEWLLDLPWSQVSTENLELENAVKVLDEDHYGLKNIKKRIIEYLAVHKLTNNNKGAILCFVGPPGVGKTSIVSSIARAAGRNLVQMSLGGVRDEAEIRGHRRTYIGAMPGRILNGMKSAGVNNPVFLLDEIDKMSSDFRGDPASAMLEVLDPNQNNQFRDHYLEIPYDLSQVMFIATANTLDSIPVPLLDRMEVIDLTGYTYEEKLQIAKRYLLPKQLKANGMGDVEVNVPDDVMMEIISDYTRESGVRNLEREIGAVVRKLAVRRLENGNCTRFDVGLEDIKEFLGAKKYRHEEMENESSVGVVSGLAWTSVGGVTLKVETVLIDGGKGDIVLTGNMGDVMKESARTAYSVVRSKAKKYGIDAEKFTKNDLHVHIPEGATPKDGPSAGITLSTAIMSVMTGRKVRNDVAMTGEVTLTGKVLAIGGLKEKSLAAFRSGIKTLIIPSQNEKDIVELPDEVKNNLTIVTVSDVEEVFERTLL